MPTKSGTLAGNNSGWSIFQRRNVLLMSKQNPIRPPATKICYFSDRLLAKLGSRVPPRGPRGERARKLENAIVVGLFDCGRVRRRRVVPS